MELNMIIPPIVGSVIGYTTNWLAIKMLFKPHKAYHIGKLRIPFTPGLIPRERDRIAKSLGEAVGGNLLTEEVILKELTNPKVTESLKVYITQDILGKSICVNEIIAKLYPKTDEFYEIMCGKIQEQIIRFVTHDSKLKELIGSKIATSIRMDKTLRELTGENLNKEFDDILFNNKVQIANQICLFLGEEEMAAKIKELIGTVLREKLGGLAAMFVQPDSLYEMILDFTRSYLEVEEHQTGLVNGIIKVKSSLLNSSVSDLIDADKYIEFIDGMTLIIYKQIMEFIEDSNFKNVLAVVMGRLFSMEFVLQEDMKERVETAIEAMYVSFAKTHLPIFLAQFNVTSIVESEVNKFSVQEVENLIFTIVDKELRAITWIGALLGLIMGALSIII